MSKLFLVVFLASASFCQVVFSNELEPRLRVTFLKDVPETKANAILVYSKGKATVENIVPRCWLMGEGKKDGKAIRIRAGDSFEYSPKPIKKDHVHIAWSSEISDGKGFRTIGCSTIKTPVGHAGYVKTLREEFGSLLKIEEIRTVDGGSNSTDEQGEATSAHPLIK